MSHHHLAHAAHRATVRWPGRCRGSDYSSKTTQPLLGPLADTPRLGRTATVGLPAGTDTGLVKIDHLRMSQKSCAPTAAVQIRSRPSTTATIPPTARKTLTAASSNEIRSS
jgi:hypothetical protein